MRLSMLAGLCLLSTAALAQSVVAPGPWTMDFILADGTYEGIPGYWSKESCEGAIAKVTEGYRGHNGRCFYNGLPVNGYTVTEGWPCPQQHFVSAYPSREPATLQSPRCYKRVRAGFVSSTGSGPMSEPLLGPGSSSERGVQISLPCRSGYARRSPGFGFCPWGGISA